MPTPVENNPASTPYLGDCTFLETSKGIVDELITCINNAINNHQNEKNSSVPLLLLKGAGIGLGSSTAVGGLYHAIHEVSNYFKGNKFGDHAYSWLAWSTVSLVSSVGTLLILNRKTVQERVFDLWNGVAEGLTSLNGEQVFDNVRKILAERKAHRSEFKETHTGLTDDQLLVALHVITGVGYMSNALKLFKDRDSTIEMLDRCLEHSVEHFVQGGIPKNDASMSRFKISVRELFFAHQKEQAELEAQESAQALAQAEALSVANPSIVEEQVPATV